MILRPKISFSTIIEACEDFSPDDKYLMEFSYVIEKDI
jgi:hypothetical protein